MHIAEGILPFRQAALYGALAFPFVGLSVWRLRKLRDLPEENIHVPLPVVAAMLFAVTLLPVPVPVAGATSHMCAVPILALLLGPWSVIAPTALVLLLQALFFSHGGLTSLGANVMTLAVTGAFSAVFLFRSLRALRVPLLVSVGIACALSDALVYVADSLILGEALSGKTSFASIVSVVLLGFAPVQIPLAILEGVLSAYAVRYLAARNPAFVRNALDRDSANVEKPVRGALAIIFVALALFCESGAVADEAPYQGIDDSVIGQVARQEGRSPRVFLEWPSNEVTLFVFSVGFFVCGAVIGLQWEKSKRRRSAPVASDSERHALV